ncbi:MAG TPA: hypothetical protein VN766_19615 [Stellaceae bacterium]|jgi:hypothetical protein|nr:hypothetical protein [Stellaceae bacterium]
MVNQQAFRVIPLLCAAALGLAACQSSSGGPFAGLFGSPEAAPPSCKAPSPDTAGLVKLQKENAKLKKQLAAAQEDNATLRDLAAKKW